MHGIKRLTPALLLLFMAAGVIFVLGPHIMDLLITPLATLLWGAWRVIASVDQRVYWAGLVVVCSGLAAWMLIPKATPRPKRAYQDSYRPPGRFEHWRELLAESTSGVNGAEHLRKAMAELVMAVVIQEGNGAHPDIEARIAERTAGLSPGARRYLFSLSGVRAPAGREKLDFSVGLRSRSGGQEAGSGGTQKSNFWGGGWRGKANSRQDVLLDEILRWMEAELGVRDEHS